MHQREFCSKYTRSQFCDKDVNTNLSNLAQKLKKLTAKFDRLVVEACRDSCIMKEKKVLKKSKLVCCFSSFRKKACRDQHSREMPLSQSKKGTRNFEPNINMHRTMTNIISVVSIETGSHYFDEIFDITCIVFY